MVVMPVIQRVSRYNKKLKDKQKEGKMKSMINPRSMNQPVKAGIESFWTFPPAKRLALPMALLFVICAAPLPAQETAGKDLRAFYQQNCVDCHGPDGSAVSEEGQKLSGQDFTDPDWKRDTGDDKMVKTILKGKFFGWAMPSFQDDLTPDEARQMVTDIIRKSKKGHMIEPDTKSSGDE